MKKASNKKTAFLYRFSAVLLWLFVWQAAAMALNQPLLLSSPVRVIARLFALLEDAAFYRALSFSFTRIALGALCGLLLGIVLALVASRSKIVEFLLQPLIITIATVPVASFIILTLMFLSSRDLSIFISFLMVLPIIYSNLLQGLKAIPRDMTEMAKMYHLSPVRRLLLVELPHVKSHLLSGASTALGMAWKSGVAAEVIGIPIGSIGENLYQSKIYFDTSGLFAWTAVIVALSVLFVKATLCVLRFAYRRLERL